jgi:hypothetical protein
LRYICLYFLLESFKNTKIAILESKSIMCLEFTPKNITFVQK